MAKPGRPRTPYPTKTKLTRYWKSARLHMTTISRDLKEDDLDSAISETHAAIDALQELRRQLDERRAALMEEEA